eukprot:m.17185 g.17185  ORF g.17185 m.17185 type:complete len:269 (-) comp5411_c0_seq1:79-885(-)
MAAAGGSAPAVPAPGAGNTTTAAAPSSNATAAVNPTPIKPDGTNNTKAAAAGAAAAAASADRKPSKPGQAEPGKELESAKVDRTKHPSGIVPTIENIVSTAFLGCRLMLQQIAMRARNSEYNPRRFSAVIIRIKDPKSTALVFASGKMVIMGSKSEPEAEQASKKFEKIVRKTGFSSVSMRDFKIHNVVGCADVKFHINLEDLHMEHGAYSKYEPEMFPGLTYKMRIPDVVLLIFSSGKVVLTKAKKREHVYIAFEKMYPLLEQFRRM